MKIEFLGTAGYHPSAQRHTSGVFLADATPEDAFVFDAGSGFFRLIWRELPARLHIFLSHAHLDHVCGLTYLYNLCYVKKTQVQIYATQATLKAVENALFDSPLFPLRMDYATQEIEAGSRFEVAGLQVSTCPLTHPGGSMAYRVDWPDKSFGYVTDTVGDGRYMDLVRDVDLLVHERNFPDSFEKVAVASGHCTSSDILRMVPVVKPKKLVLTHFNPLTAHDPLTEDGLYEKLPGVISAVDEMVVEF